jgi:hypothetical protein
MSNIELLPGQFAIYLAIFRRHGINTIEKVKKLGEKELLWLALYYYVSFLSKPQEADRYMVIFPSHGITSIRELRNKTVEELREIGLKPFHAKKFINMSHKVQSSLYDDVKNYQQSRSGSLIEALRFNIGAVFVPSK